MECCNPLDDKKIGKIKSVFFLFNFWHINYSGRVVEFISTNLIGRGGKKDFKGRT